MLPLAIIIPSTFVSFFLLSASSAVKTSPFPITGILTLCFTLAIISQSALPSYICCLVLPCIAIASAPADSITLANSTAFIFSLSNPFLNLTVTGFVETFFIASTIFPASFGSFNNAEPSPFLVILLAGHPIFISKIHISSL